MHKRNLVFLFLLCFAVRSAAQQGASLPAAFYLQKTNTAKALFLKNAVQDSIAANHLSHVPAWCHIALSLAADHTATDTIPALMWQFLGDAYAETQYDSSAFYYRKSLSHFPNISLLKKIYLGQSLLYEYVALDKKDSILHHILELERIIAPLPDTFRKKLVVVNTIASSYGAISRYDDAIRSFRYVIRQALMLQDTTILRNALINTGNMYNELGNVRMALYYTLQAVPYLSKEPYGRIATYGNLSRYYATLNILDSASSWLTLAEKLAKADNDEEAVHSIAIQRANILLSGKNYSATENILAKSLKFFQEKPPGVDLINCLLVYSSLDTAQKKFGLANEHLQALYTLTKGMNQRAFTAATLNMLAEVNGKLGNYQEAYQYQSQYMAIKDSLNVAESQKGLAALQVEYQTYKKEEQISGLKKEARIKDLELGTAGRNRTLFITLSLLLIASLGTALYVRSVRSKAQLMQLKAGLEMKALRSQMNPHFIFNSLNSIQKYIWENRQEDAAEYLTKFARLIRLVLENSLHTSVELSEELAALKLYIDLEHRRNNQKFDYSISVSPDIDADAVEIPPLILQPYVENAIWHGLSQKDDRGILRINISKKGTSLICSIEDDGIGRAEAARIRASATPKTSLGMNISSQRIASLQTGGDNAATVEVIDNFHEGVASGTKVVLTLPLILKHD